MIPIPTKNYFFFLNGLKTSGYMMDFCFVLFIYLNKLLIVYLKRFLLLEGSLVLNKSTC